MQWYYVFNGERVGPVPQDQFDRLLQTGVLNASTLVWRVGMDKWLPWAQAALLTLDPDSAVCAVSGRVYPKREMLEYQGQWVSAENKDIFFQRMRESVPIMNNALTGEVRYAGFWIRFLAIFIDGLCMGAINFVIGIGFMIIMAILGMNPLGQQPSAGSHETISGAFLIIQILKMLLNFVCTLAYQIYFIRRYDATPGKMAVGIKVIRSYGDKLSVGRIIGREFSRTISFLILCIGYIMAGWDDEKRTLHDMICDTRVVYK